jgi:signal transduction histidine kinase
MKQLARQLKSELIIDSEPGKGTKISIQVPVGADSL